MANVFKLGYLSQYWGYLLTTRTGILVFMRPPIPSTIQTAMKLMTFNSKENEKEAVISTEPPVDIKAEQQKRTAVLELLYNKMIRQPISPAMNARELETELGMEKASLDVTVWYLKERTMIRTGDNGRFLITADGIDRFESQRS